MVVWAAIHMSLSPERSFERVPSVFRCLAKAPQIASTCSPHPIREQKTLLSLVLSRYAPQSCPRCCPSSPRQVTFTFVPPMEHSDLTSSRAPGRSAAWAALSCSPFRVHSADLLLRGTALGQVKVPNQDHSHPPPTPRQDPPSKQGHQGGTKACHPPRHRFILQ